MQAKNYVIVLVCSEVVIAVFSAFCNVIIIALYSLLYSITSSRTNIHNINTTGYPVVMSVKGLFKFSPINRNVTVVYITVTDYGALKLRAKYFVSKHIYCLLLHIT